MLFLKWLLLTCLYAVSIYVAESQFGALTYLVQNDVSYICYALFGVLGLGSLFALFGHVRRVDYLSETSTVLGLMGSIVGMMFLFSGGFDDTARIGAGLGTAMGTTLVGIVVAVMLSLYSQVQKGGRHAEG